MKKRNNFTRLTIASAVAFATLTAAAFPIVGTATTANAEETVNKTAVLDSSYYTRVMGEVPGSAATTNWGASIELDVISSDLKSAENIQWIKDQNPTLTFNDAITYTPFAGVTFDFWQSSTALNDKAQGLCSGETGLTTIHSKAFNYYADGQITITNQYDITMGSTRQGYYPTLLDATTGELSWNTEYAANFSGTYPTDHNPVGSIEEVENFLNEGYSYRLDFVWGHATEEGFKGEKELCADGVSRYNPWFVAYKKAFGATEWQYCFAVPTWREIGSATADNTVYAGFEICANQPYYKQSQGNGCYDNFGNNVKMEVDNVSIYGRQSGNPKTVLDFNSVDATAFAIDDSEIQSVNRWYAAGVGNMPPVGSNYKTYYNENVWTSGTYTVNSINAPMEGIAAPATRTLNTYYNVTYTVDGATTMEMVKPDASATYTLSETGKEGYVLLGWLNEADGKLYKAGATYALTGNVDFEAVYAKVENVEGASVRVGGNDGIRFKSVVTGNLDVLKEAGVTYEFGVYITDAAKTKTVGGKCDVVLDGGDGTYVYYGVLTGLDGYYTTEFVADAYVKVTYADGTTQEFSAEDSTVTRSYAYVVEAALKDVRATNTENELYKTAITIDGETRYSCYSKTLYEGLMATYKEITGNDFTFPVEG